MPPLASSFSSSAPTPLPNSNFGTSVAIDGNIALIGAYGIQSHIAYAFDITTGSLLDQFNASGGTTGDAFGSAVALSGNLALVGAMQHYFGPNDGTAYLFAVAPEPSSALLIATTLVAMGASFRRTKQLR